MHPIRFSTFFFILVSLFAINAMAMNSKISSDDYLKAVRLGNLDTVNQYLAENGAVDARDNERRTALLIATWENQIQVAKRLLEAGADVNAKDSKQDSPFLVAGAEGRVAILEMILKFSPDLTSLNRFGGTALIPACEKGHPDAVRLLIAAGVDLNHINNLGWNCLLEVVLLGKSDSLIYQDIVQQLIVAQADLNLTDKRGLTAYQYAKRFNLKKIASLLAEAGAK